MSWDRCTVATIDQLRPVNRAIKDYFDNGEKVDIQIRRHISKRGDAQNRLQHHWMRELEVQGSKRAEEYRAYCKLHIGIPILREDDDFRAKYDATIRKMDYESKLMLMLEPFNLPVTSIMTVEDMARYLSGVEQHFTQQGYRLTTGDDLYFEAIHGKARVAA